MTAPFSKDAGGPGQGLECARPAADHGRRAGLGDRRQCRGGNLLRDGRGALLRSRLTDLLPFGSPVLSSGRARRTNNHATVDGYKIDISTPRTGNRGPVDVFIAPLPQPSDAVAIMLQERAIAEKIDRQLTHRSAARSITALGLMLAHEIKNPLSGIRGAAQLLEANASDDDRALTRLICEETDRIVKLVDRMQSFADSTPSQWESLNIHAVLDHVKRLAQAGFARRVRFAEIYDPSLPHVLRLPRPAHSGVPEFGQERRGSYWRR